MPTVGSLEKKAAWIVSVALGIVILAVAGLWFFGTSTFDEYVVIAIMIIIFPPTVVNFIDYRWRKSVDERLPDLFRTIVQAQQTGMTLPQALEEASKRDYGPLTKELKKMVSQMAWGASFEEALESFAKRVDTVLVKRTVPLVVEASRAGGRVEKVFEPIGKFVQSTLLLEKERKARTRPYLAIIYVAFFVFLFTIVLLFRSFFTQIGEDALLGNALLSPDAAKRLFFHMSAIQAFFSGLVAGKMGEGTLYGGLKHSLILLLLGFFALKLFL
ncbi:MAG: type II secretion system F family protein [Candidatus Bathyarchaeales archaeon]